MALEVAASLLEERELPAMVFKGQHTVKAIYVREMRCSICVPGDRHSVLPRLVLAAAHCFCFLCLPLHSSWFSEFLKMCFLLKFLMIYCCQLRYPIQWCFPCFMPSSTLSSWLYFAEQGKHQHFEFGQWLGSIIIAKLNVPHQFSPERVWINPMLHAHCFQDLVSFIRMRGICLSCRNFHHILGPLLRVQC